MEFLSHPIPDRGVPGSTENTIVFLQHLTARLQAGSSLVLHCRQGVGRSGMMAAAALMIAGSGAVESIEVVSRARGLVVPETPEQRQWLECLAARHLALAS